MSFAQFLTLLVCACLVLLSPVPSLIGLAFAVEELGQLSATLFAIAVVVRRRGVAPWLPLVGWLALGALMANLVLPTLGVRPAFQAETPGLGWAEIGWRLVFLALLLRGQGEAWAPAVDLGQSEAVTSSVRRDVDGRLELRLWNPGSVPLPLDLELTQWEAVQADGQPDPRALPVGRRHVLRPFGLLTLRQEREGTT